MIALTLACVASSLPTSVIGDAFEADLVFTPSAPVVGPQALEIDLRDADGEPLLGAEVQIGVLMPAHGHGLEEDPEVSERGDGLYDTAWVWPMAGEWAVEIALPELDDSAMVDVHVD